MTKEIVLNPFNDKFFEENLMKNYGEFAEMTQRYVLQFASKRKDVRELKTIEEMQKFVEHYPEFLAEQGSVSKHLSLVQELKEVVGTRKLMELSMFEQDIVCQNKFNAHFEQLQQFIGDSSFHDFDKLKLTLIFIFRYQHKLDDHLSTLRTLLRQHCQLEGREIEVWSVFDLLSSILDYFGMDQRSTPLFEDEKTKLIGKLTSLVKFQFIDIECVFTQHKPLLSRVIDEIMKNQLKVEHFPYLSDATLDKPPKDLIIFIVGGATYEEALTVSAKRQEHKCNIVLGSPWVHNSYSFLKDSITNFTSFLDTA
ncbi:vacuolar protein sorting 45 [Reticulomyxa filosa]|uniref:Vacuolar protein sorting 45 n=1 Tax=Reticulomyxa filosa TaxID=46433 RepID=X6NQT7_RETFI|nr:vacuolar protein sorting 45 [Reticulomyxa filosa]|eukprot:ETO28665.1 vacuolar protein sorting 45 [Reticulomyxa filosa]